MKHDALSFAAGRPSAKRVSKETLNHRGVIEHFGRPGKFIIGGIETVRLSTGTPGEVLAMVLRVHEQTPHLPGFAMASCGGLHGDIPLANLEAYFDARVEIGITPKDWRTRCRKEETP